MGRSRALIIGIDHYEIAPLGNCCSDAKAVSKLLARNEDDSANFSVRELISSEALEITRKEMQHAVRALFTAPAETALLYFAGHGDFNADSSSATLLAQNGEEDRIGLALHDIIEMANKADSVTTKVIILDCCNAGSIGDIQGIDRAPMGKGVTILTSTDRQQVAESTKDGGIFTSLMIDALQGAAADIRGNITPASIYSHVDQALGGWGQRPIYKANVQEFISLRQVEPRVPDEILRRLPTWFEKKTDVFPLDPSFEPDIKPGTEADFPEEVRSKNQAIFAEMQKCNRYGLIVPVNAPHMYHAAMQKTGCKLTAKGAFFWYLSKNNLLY